MSNGDGKRIELGLGANVSEFRNVRHLVNDLVKSFQNLNAEVAKLGQAGGGFGRGAAAAAGGGVFSTRSAVSGIGIQAHSGGTPYNAGSPIAGLNKDLLASRDTFRAVAAGTKESMRAMSTSLRDEAAAQTREITRLRHEISGLAEEYGRLRKVDLSGGTALRENRARYAAAHQELGGAMGVRDAAVERAAQIDAMRAGTGNYAAKPTLFERAGNFVGQVTGLNPATVGAAGAIAYGVRVVTTGVSSALAENGAASWDWMRRGQMMGRSYGQAGQEAHFGDFRLALARQFINDDPQLRADRAKIGLGLSTGISGVGSGSTGGTTLDAEGWRRSQAALRAGGQFIKGNWVGAVNDAKRSIGDLPFNVAEEQLQFDRAYMEAHPERFNAANQLMSNYGSDMGNMRLFMSGARRNPNANYAGARTNGGINRARKYTGMGLLSEAGQAIHGIEGIAGSGTGQRGAHLASAIAGHLYAAPTIYGQAALGGDPGLFFGATQNLIGRSSGGMDVQAGGRLGSIASGAIMSGSGYTSGLGLLGAMSQYARGGSSAGDMGNTAFAGQALSNMNRITSGQLDPYQGGVNLLAAIKAAPNAGIFGQEYLARMDTRQMVDVMSGADLPPDLKALGIDRQAVRGTFLEQQRRMLDRNIGLSPGQNGQANPMQRMMGVMGSKYGGDFGAMVKDMGLKGANLEDAVSRYGTWLSATGQADNYQSGAFMARMLATGMNTPAQTKRIAGRGAGDSAAGSTEMELNRAKSDLQAADEQERQQKDATYRGKVQTLAQQEQSYRTVQNQLMGGGIAPSIERVNAELGDLANVIRQRTREIAGWSNSGQVRNATVGRR